MLQHNRVAGPARAVRMSRVALTYGVSAAALILSSVPGLADDATPVEQVVVTGTHLRLTGMETPVPVTAVSADELAAMSPTSLIEGLTQLPEFYNSQTPASPTSWFTRAGYGNLDIRGLGPNRTLTLLNGRRVISQTAFGGVDITMFPQDLIKTVETVTGGASAAYGTDAIAGVANFILDTNFTGLRLTAQGGETTRGDAQNYNFGGSFGMALGDRGHLLASGQISSQDGVNNYKGRDWYQGWGTVPNAAGVLQIVPHVVSRGSTFGGLISSPNAALNGLMFNPDGSTSPFVSSSLSTGAIGGPGAHQSVTTGGSGDDLGAAIQTIYPDVKHNNEFVYADYDLTNDLNVFAQFLRGEESTFRYNTPSGSLQGTPTAITIFSGNAFLPASVQAIMTANNIASFTLRRTGNLTDFGAQMTLADHSTMNSFTTGFDWGLNGGMLDGWKVDGYYQYGQNARNGYQVGLRVDRIFAAVDAVKDPATGNIVCRTTLFNNQFPGCQPLDLFGVGNASAAAVNYVVGSDPGVQVNTPLYFAGSGYAPGQNYSYTSREAKVITTDMRQQVAELSVNGDLYEGWGAGPITAAFGGTYRKENIRQIVQDTTNPPDDNDHGHPVLCNGDPAAVAAGLRGVNPPDCANTVGIQYSKVSNILGSIDVKELFTETHVPIIKDSLFMQSLGVDLAARWADYSGSGAVWAYKAGMNADVVDGIRLRGTFSRDVRAANLSERFDKTGGSAVVTDPKYPGDGPVTVTIFSGGNPDVRPEKADTYTGGVVYEPEFLDGASFSVDYYHIKIKDAIGQLGAQAVVNQCQAGAAVECALITRDPTTDRLVLVGNVYVNINSAIVSGVDFEGSYHRDVNWFGGADEAISARFFGSWLMENSTTNAGAAKIDRAGQTGIQQSDGVAYALPHFKATGDLTYDYGMLSLFLQGRYIGSGTIENALKVGKDIVSNSVDSAFYLDTRMGYRFDAPADLTGNMEAFLSVTNLLDQDPPITPYFSAFNGYAMQDNPALFDVLGRRFVVGVKYTY